CTSSSSTYPLSLHDALPISTRDRSGHGGFLVGTVICKLLLISIPSDIVGQQVPSLVNPIQWQAYITPTFSSSDRAIQTVTLIQRSEEHTSELQSQSNLVCRL